MPTNYPVLTAAQMRQLDRYTIDQGGISGMTLMEKAASKVLQSILERWSWAKRLLIFCGPGNNGGDGLALAILAKEAGKDACVCLVDPRGEGAWPPESDPRHFLGLSHTAGIEIMSFEAGNWQSRLEGERLGLIVVDAMFGTGLDRDLVEPYVGLIGHLNDFLSENNIPIVSVDIPSGLNADTGMPMGAAVKADMTVSFGQPKLGFYHPAACEYLGLLLIEDIGLAKDIDAATSYSAFDEEDWLPFAALNSRRRHSHKGDYGKVLIIAGHRRYPGAPRLAAEGAARMGAGLIRLVVPDPIYSVSCSNPGIMVDGHPEDGFGGVAAAPSSSLLEYLDWADSVVIGPGFGAGEAGQVLVKKLLSLAKQPVVLDADALRALPCPHVSTALVLTPHAGELARLLSISVEELMPKWLESARTASARLDAYVLAKSNQCALATADGRLYFPRRGHPAMAVGGSGDVLSGMIGTLLAQHQEYHCVEDAVCAAVNMHSAAANLYAARRGETGMSPLDLARYVPRALEAARDSLWQNPL